MREEQNNPEAKASIKQTSSTTSVTQPLADIFETQEGATLYIDLPGVDKESLNIDVDKDVLSIKGKIALDIPDGLEATYMDIRSGRYERHFTLGEELDSHNIQADFKQGELKLFIPRSERHKPRKIEIKTG